MERRVPQGSFVTWERVLRGYGPFFMLAALVVGMAVFVPSRVPDRAVGTVVAGPTGGTPGTQAGADGQPGTGPSPTGAGADVGSGAVTVDGGAAGAPTGGASAGSGAVPPPGAGATGACADRTRQVPNDPYSPACVEFAGDNGGATSRGVTATEIHVALRQTQDAGAEAALAEILGADLVDTRADVERTMEALVEYFNTNFQLYGRKIVLDRYEGQGSLAAELQGQGRDRAEVDATRVAEDLGSFADLSAGSEPYSDALVRRGVMAFGAPVLSREWFTARRPYAWSALPDCSTVTEMAGEYILKRLAGGTADLAAGDLRGRPRRITAIVPDNSWYQECLRSTEQLLAAGGYEFEVEPISYRIDVTTMSSQASNIVPKLRAEGVTTILCGCDPIFPSFLSGVANRDGYYPEFVSGYEQDVFGQLWQQDFTAQAFGISPLGAGASAPAYETFGYQAYKTVRDDEPAVGVDGIYYGLYLFVIGVQGAGPNLTPETFEQGMFAYPEASGPAGLWAFGPEDYTPMEDYHEMYWDPDAVSPYNGKPGSWVDPNPGQRYRFGSDELPTGPPDIPRDR